MLDSHEGKNINYGIKHRNLGFISKRKGTSGNITEWVNFAVDLQNAVKMKNTKNKALKGWKLVAAPGYNRPMGNLSPGDILIYRNGPNPKDTGHVMIAMGKPNTRKRAGFSTLLIADSTQFPKYDDERAKDHPKNKNKKMKKDQTGMGKGTIHLRKNKADVLQVEKKKNTAVWVNLYVVRPV